MEDDPANYEEQRKDKLEDLETEKWPRLEIVPQKKRSLDVSCKDKTNHQKGPR